MNSRTNHGSNRLIYVVKDIEGNVRFKGTAKQIEERYGIDARNVQAYYNITHLYENKYRIDRETEDEATLDYLERHIVRYGNTCLSGMNQRKVERLLAILYERTGIKCTYKRRRYKEDLSAWYVIERVKKECTNLKNASKPIAESCAK